MNMYPAERPIRGIVFDMDGVLVLSSAIHAEAFRHTLAAFPFPPPEYSSVAGMRTDEAIRKILSSKGVPFSDETIGALAAAKSATARKLLIANYPFAVGCAELIPRLADTCPLALASSGSKESVDLFLDSSGLRIYFTATLHGGDVIAAKPAPDIYQLAFHRLGLAPEDCLIVEDAVAGVLAGKAAGARVWGLPGSSATADELILAGADRTIASLDDLYPLCR